MELALTDIDGDAPAHVKEVYVGPSALWIANRVPHRVRFSEGWFWTTTKICHGGRSEELAFRQSPDGNGIDVRCLTGGCSRDLAIAGLETATGLSIGRAYVPVTTRADRLWWLRDWPRERLAWYGTAGLVFAAPFLVGFDLQVLEVALLSCSGYGLGSWLMVRWMLRCLRRRAPG